MSHCCCLMTTTMQFHSVSLSVASYYIVHAVLSQPSSPRSLGFCLHFRLTDRFFSHPMFEFRGQFTSQNGLNVMTDNSNIGHLSATSVNLKCKQNPRLLVNSLSTFTQQPMTVFLLLPQQLYDRGRSPCLHGGMMSATYCGNWQR